MSNKLTARRSQAAAAAVVIGLSGLAVAPLAAQAQVATTALPDDGVEAAIPQPEVQGIPSREAVRDRLFNAKINTAAEGLLADLRADAIIRRP